MFGEISSVCCGCRVGPPRRVTALVVFARSSARQHACRVCGAVLPGTGDLCASCRHEAAEPLRRAAGERVERQRAEEAEQRQQREHADQQRQDALRQEEGERLRRLEERRLLEDEERRRDEEARQQEAEARRQSRRRRCASRVRRSDAEFVLPRPGLPPTRPSTGGARYQERGE